MSTTIATQAAAGAGGGVAGGATQAERSARSDRALIQAAIDLIAERGYERTTLAAIGEASGYSRGLVTQRFGSKEGLLWEVVERMLKRWGAHSLRPRVGATVGADALVLVVDAYTEAVASSPNGVRALYALLFEAMGPVPALRPKFEELHRHMRRDLAGWIRAGQAQGTVRPGVDAETEAALFLGTIRGVTLQWLLDPKSVRIEQVLREYARGLKRSLEARGGSRSGPAE
ncbi:MAG TPA: TetR/AcrR family transcriptional regulator [Acidimicrobiales bacterium]|nr:TetR/AcrR family transcriptional regulator [Acidimicrobiales bacterium]